VPLGEVGQGVHAVPQALRLLAGTQIPLQGFFPIGQFPSHGVASSTQPSPHGFLPAGQETPHLVPSQVAIPPVTVGHSVQLRPQVSGEVLSTQAPLQRCCAAGQLGSLAGAAASSPVPVGAGASSEVAPPIGVVVPGEVVGGRPPDGSSRGCAQPAAETATRTASAVAAGVGSHGIKEGRGGGRCMQLASARGVESGLHGQPPASPVDDAMLHDFRRGA
jgi:hypothetical protein